MNSKTIDAPVSQEQIDVEHTLTGSSPEILAPAFIDNLHYVQGRPASCCRSIRTNFNRWKRSFRDRQHEILFQWSFDNRDTGWCQC